MQLLPSARENVLIWNRCQAIENMEPLPSADKHANGAKRGKIDSRCQARINMLGAKRGKHASETVNCAGSKAPPAKRDRRLWGLISYPDLSRRFGNVEM